MGTFILSLAIVLLAISGLSIGILFGRPPIKGSCGGLSCIKNADCSACPNRNKAS